MTESIESQPDVEPPTGADVAVLEVVPASDDAVAEVAADAPTEVVDPVVTVDLEAIATELADVEIALARLDSGAYWTDEVTGEPLPDDLLERSPVARRLPGA